MLSYRLAHTFPFSTSSSAGATPRVWDVIATDQAFGAPPSWRVSCDELTGKGVWHVPHRMEASGFLVAQTGHSIGWVIELRLTSIMTPAQSKARGVRNSSSGLIVLNLGRTYPYSTTLLCPLSGPVMPCLWKGLLRVSI